jgi:general secretion pathway protein M
MNRPLNPSALQARWKALAPREQNLALIAGTVVLLALLWWLLLAPALRTLREAPAQHARLDAELQHMQTLRAEALQLQAQPPTKAQDARQGLQKALAQHLGAAGHIQFAADRATVTLKGADAAALALWLAQARSNARAVVLEAKLTRAPNNAKDATTARWDGSLTLALPQDQNPS